MIIDRFASRYPQLFHMAEKRNWNNIVKYGLLSTTALLDLFEYHGDRRYEVESKLRDRGVLISHPAHGKAFIRDQVPMCDRPSDGISLRKCLVGITLEEWLQFLNGKTFFWTDFEHLTRLVCAVLYRSRSHYVITVDSTRLLAGYRDKVSLSSLNSGSLYGRNGELPRSRDTFKPLSKCVPMSQVIEVAVDYAVPDIMDVATSVDEYQSQWSNGKRIAKKIRHIWPT